VWTGVILYTLNFVVWIIVLYKVDLSIALPVGSACYIFVPLAAVFFLHETITPVRWLGILCIVLGVFFVSQSRKRAEEKQW
jgi:drug/metabolite transporter (DMT)-like permease